MTTSIAFVTDHKLGIVDREEADGLPRWLTSKVLATICMTIVYAVNMFAHGHCAVYRI